MTALAATVLFILAILYLLDRGDELLAFLPASLGMFLVGSGVLIWARLKSD